MARAVAYGGFDPELGAHTFIHDDGSSLLTPDFPEARRLASTLQSLAPQPVAQNTPMGPDTAIDARPQVEASVADVPQASGATGNEAGVMRSGAMRAGLDVVNPQQLPTLPGVGAAGGAAAGTTASGLTPDELALIGKSRPASPGETPAQFAARVAKGRLVRSGQEVTTVGAHPLPPWIAEAQGAAQEAQFKAHTAVANAQLELADLAVAEIRDKRASVEQELRDKKYAEAVREDIAQMKMDSIKQFDADAQVRYAEFGPERLFKRKGTWATIGAAIAQGLGAYAAIASGTGRNYAQEIIQSAIDRDVQAQRDEYLRDRDVRNNLVADLTRATGDVETATQAAKLIQNNLAQSHAQELAALSKRTDITNNWVLWQADWQKGVADQYERLHNTARGQVTTKDTFKQEYPRARSGGGPLTIQQLAAQWEAGAKIVKARNQATGRDVDEHSAKRLESAAEKLAALSKLEQAVKEVEKAGVEGTATSVGSRLPGAKAATGAAAAAGYKPSQKIEAQRGAWGDYVSAEVAQESGAGVSNEEFARRARSKEGQYGTAEAKRAALERSKAKIAAQRKALLQGLSPQERAELRRRNVEVTLEQYKEGDAGPKETP